MKFAPSNIIKKICYTEKFTDISTRENKYVFDVDVDSTKSDIANAVSAHFNVTVVSVNTIRRDGKMRRNRTKRGVYGLTARRKLAIVKLKDEDKIEIV